MKEIQLSRGLVALVDDCDFEYLNQFVWWAIHPSARAWYAVRAYRDENSERKFIYMHREIWGVTDPAVEIDHNDHGEFGGLDNRRENLRVATSSEQKRNQRVRLGPKSSRFKGVGWHTQRLKWRAYIVVDGRQKSLGLYLSEEDAALAYNRAALEVFGEFAHLNAVSAEAL